MQGVPRVSGRPGTEAAATGNGYQRYSLCAYSGEPPCARPDRVRHEERNHVRFEKKPKTFLTEHA